jgi:hypothetical protein
MHPCRIVQRSSLLNGLYGPDFKHREAMAPGGLPTSYTTYPCWCFRCSSLLNGLYVLNPHT